jgi:enamine deaminase RidA (YjgF/YER057c/UK114 family)
MATGTQTVADRLAAVAAYIPAVRTGNLVYVSGQLPFVDGTLTATGPVPSRIPVEAAQAAARQCILNGLAILADQLGGDLGRVRRIVRVGVWVQSDPGFTEQPKVANGASELLQQLFGESGRHARAAVGSVALPLGASVEVELLAEVSD